jgi:hypothetical protein
LAETIEIGYGSQCWKLEVTPSGSDFIERALSVAEPLVFLVNSCHSEASKEATFSGDIGVDVAGSDLKLSA